MARRVAEVEPVPKTAAYRTRRRWSPEDARAALGALADSGLSPSAFARREGLDVQRLRVWRRKLGVAGPAATRAAFVEVVARASREAERIEVVLRSGVVVRVAETVDVEALARLVRVLDASC